MQWGHNSVRYVGMYLNIKYVILESTNNIMEADISSTQSCLLLSG